MTLSESVKSQIQTEYNTWFESQYGDKSKKERQKLGQFFTPPALTIRMLEKYDDVANKDILDPTVGAGGLLAAAIIAGADPRRCFGIELDPDILKIAQRRLLKLGVPPSNLHRGDALKAESYNFESFKPNSYVVLYKGKTTLEATIVNGTKTEEKSFDLILDKPKIKKLLDKIKEKKITAIKL